MREVVYVVRRRKCGHLHGKTVIGTVIAANRQEAQGKAWKCQFEMAAFDHFRWPVTEFPEIVAATKAEADYRQIAERDADRRNGLPDDAYYGRQLLTIEKREMKKARRMGEPLNWWQRLAIKRGRNCF